MHATAYVSQLARQEFVQQVWICKKHGSGELLVDRQMVDSV